MDIATGNEDQSQLSRDREGAGSREVEERKIVQEQGSERKEEQGLLQGQEPLTVVSEAELEPATEQTQTAEVVSRRPGARDYELAYLVDAGLDSERVDETVKRVRGVVERLGGVVENVRISEPRRIEYEIGKRSHAIYIVVNFQADGRVVAELDRIMRLDGRFLRHMILLMEH